MGKYAFFIVSAVIFSLLTYSSAVRNALFQSNFRTVESFSQNQAYNIAQSAALVAVNDIRHDAGSNFAPDEDLSYSYPSESGFAAWTDLEGYYNIKSTNYGDTLLVVQATGRFEETDYRTTLGIHKEQLEAWEGAMVDQAVHAESYINLGNGDVVGDVSVNQTSDNINIKHNGEVDGDYYFYDENLDPEPLEEGYDGVTGDAINMSEEINYPDPLFPNFPSGRLPVTENSTQTLSPSDYEPYHFDQFTANNMTIDVGTEDRELVVRSLDLSQNIEITGAGNLSIYVEETLTLDNGMINTTGQPDNLTIYYKGTEDIEYEGNGSFTGTLFLGNSEAGFRLGGTPEYNGHIISYGDRVELDGTPDIASLVYAPYASVEMGGSAGSFNGAIVSDTFTAEGQPLITYDPDFASTLPELKQVGEPEYTLLYWN